MTDSYVEITDGEIKDKLFDFVNKQYDHWKNILERLEKASEKTTKVTTKKIGIFTFNRTIKDESEFKNIAESCFTNFDYKFYGKKLLKKTVQNRYNKYNKYRIAFMSPGVTIKMKLEEYADFMEAINNKT